MQTIPLALHPPSPEIKMRPVRLGDIPLLHKSCWEDRTSAFVHQIVSRAQNLALQGRGLGVVVVDTHNNNDLIGYGQLTLWAQCGEISDLIVAEDCRGQGIGTAMIQYLVRVAKEMQIDCVEIGAAKGNPRALALYQRLGFEPFKKIDLDLGAGLEAVTYLHLKFPKRRRK